MIDKLMKKIIELFNNQIKRRRNERSLSVEKIAG